MSKPRTAADKFREDLDQRIKWWQTEFDLDLYQVVGVLADAAVDVMFGMHSSADVDSEEEEEDEEDEDEEE